MRSKMEESILRNLGISPDYLQEENSTSISQARRSVDQFDSKVRKMYRAHLREEEKKNDK